MKYLCLIYQDESLLQKMPKGELGKMSSEYKAWSAETAKGGHYVDGHGLQPAHTATTVRVRNGKTLTTDGPFAETKEQLGGYHLVEANDLDEAIRIAAGIPRARIGSIEVRPCWGAG